MRSDLRVLEGGVSVPPADGFEVVYVDDSGAEHRASLRQARSVRFEEAKPVRRIPSYRGQRNLPGLWWSATLGAHVGFESWLERDHAMLLDFDPAVVGLSSQPLWLCWANAAGRSVSHAPDYFARRSDGSGIVVDCRPLERRKPRDMSKFAATREACEEVGWEYRLVGAPDAIATANVRWLAGYRHPRYWQEPVAAELQEVFARPRGMVEGAGLVGDLIAVMPVLFHLLWGQVLQVDLSVPLHAESVVHIGREA